MAEAISPEAIKIRQFLTLMNYLKTAGRQARYINALNNLNGCLAEAHFEHFYKTIKRINPKTI